jgi:hypothetical protein
MPWSVISLRSSMGVPERKPSIKPKAPELPMKGPWPV